MTYHGVLPQGYKSVDADLDGALVNADSFRRQLRLLKSHYHVISPAEFLSWCEARNTLPPRSVLLTCDDGLMNTVTEMLPILQAEELSCLFFVTGASLTDEPGMQWYEELYLMLRAVPSRGASGVPDAFSSLSGHAQDKRSLWWSLVKSLSQYDPKARDEFLKSARLRLHLPEDWKRQWSEDRVHQRRFRTLTATQVRQLAASGMSIGAHSMNHPILSFLSESLAWYEISESRRALERLLGAPVWALAYPFGDRTSVSQREVEMAKRASYKCAFLNVGGVLGEETSMFALPRVHVTANMSQGEFEARMSGFHEALRRHFVGLEPSPVALRS